MGGLFFLGGGPASNRRVSRRADVRGCQPELFREPTCARLIIAADPRLRLLQLPRRQDACSAEAREDLRQKL